MFGERTKARPRPLPNPDDSPDATTLLLRNAPIACPTCGAHTRPADNTQGWLCTSPACVFST